AVALGPLSMTIVFLARHGTHGWDSLRASGWPWLILLPFVIRPAIILLKPLRLHESGLSWLIGEGGKLLLGALVGSSLIVSGSLVFQNSSVGRLDIICDFCLYLFLMTVVGLWHAVPHHKSHLAKYVPTGSRNGASGREKLLLVGSGVELGIYVSALSAL